MRGYDLQTSTIAMIPTSHSTMDSYGGDDRQSITNWVSKQTVFITGATGFIGKALLFKLLQCGVQRIFVLIRPKRGKQVQERLNSMLKEEIFQSLIKEDADVMKKLVAMPGDVTELGLGLSEEDRTRIQNEATIVFSAAASVKFDDPLKLAIITNLRSVREIIDLAKGIKNLKMLHHVSTAYSNADHMCSSTGVQEQVYERKMDWQKLITFAETASEELMDAITLKLMGASTNSYMFTKHIAEAVIEDAGKEIPAMISRPPIVICSIKEPLPGWLDNVSSPCAIIGGTGKGVLRLYLGTRDADKAYIPVDTCINCILTSTWRECALRLENSSKVMVYNMDHNIFTTGQLHEICVLVANTVPVHNAIWHLHFYTIDDCDLFLILHIFLHFIPGLLIDSLLVLNRQKPRMTRLYRKLYMALLLLLPFLNVKDKFKLDNYKALQNSIPDKEKEIFNLNVVPDESMLKYMCNAAMGFRKLLGEPPYPSEKDFIHAKRLYWLDKCFLTFCGLLILWLFPYNIVLYPLFYISSSLIHFYNTL